jgi:hypothetical protein
MVVLRSGLPFEREFKKLVNVGEEVKSLAYRLRV